MDVVLILDTFMWYLLRWCWCLETIYEMPVREEQMCSGEFGITVLYQ